MLLNIIVVISNLLLIIPIAKSAQKPNIIFIIADDLGWNDVGFNGLNNIPTPNIDSLAYSGIILNNYYVTPICTPSRSALMTGKYPIHTGMQHTVLFGAERRGLPLSEKILAQYLEEQGYINHIVGKWHLGSYTKHYTPLFRGFRSHTGYWTGHQDYFDHTANETGFWGLDMRRNMEIAYDLYGKYSTDIFTEESVKIINQHDTESPLFLYLAHAAVHSGNPYNPLPAPDKIIEKFDYLKSYNRRRFAAMLTKLDESVGKIAEALKNKNMLENSIIVFTTDNGGPAEGFNSNAASNYPLRGVKNTLWEGGVRGAAFIWSPLITKKQRIARQLMHITDWLPTLLSATGTNTSNLQNLDGYDLWSSLSSNLESKRTQILHNIDNIYGSSSLTVGPWKIVKGTNYNGSWDGWYGPSGREMTYNMTLLKNSQAYKALLSINQAIDLKHIEKLRKEAEVSCGTSHENACLPLESPCLFNILQDPCERNNLADKYPNILKNLLETLDVYNKTAIPPNNTPVDPAGDPKNFNYVWTNFGDY